MGNVIVSSDPIPMISISVEEYKALLQAQTELNVIYHKSVNGDVYDLSLIHISEPTRH